jgi:hypothetical protein
MGLPRAVQSVNTLRPYDNQQDGVCTLFMRSPGLNAIRMGSYTLYSPERVTRRVGMARARSMLLEKRTAKAMDLFDKRCTGNEKREMKRETKRAAPGADNLENAFPSFQARFW